MSLMEAVSVCLKEKYADFSGRARRSEFWFWYLALAIWYLVLVVLVFALSKIGIFLLVVGMLVIFVPTLAVQVRRLHDTGKSGWLLLLGIIPFGGIVLLVFYIMDSTPSDNQYGPNPKGVNGMPTGYWAPPPAPTA